MRLGKLVGGIAIAVIVFWGAVTPALAKEKVEGEFEATEGGKTTNVSQGSQQFKFGPFKLACLGASSTGEATMGKSKVLKDKIKWEGCTSGKGKGRAEAKFSTWEVEFNSNGTFTIVNTPKISIPAVSCVINLESGTVGEAEGKHNPITYKTVTPKKGEVAGRKVEIKAKVKVHEEEGGIGWEFNEKKVCGKLEETSGEDGTWKGTLVDEAVKGELAFT
jgi:hypothetical protein